jgi:CheY-like chemotaxis protein
MADQRLKYCSVLVVDDSAPSRSLVASSLYDIGVGTINTVPHGAAAIEYLRHSALSSLNGITPPVDMVISEFDMKPVGGLMLIQWLRRSWDTPDRFMRTVIMSGSLDMEKVDQARAMGVNAMFAKPFSINLLKKNVLSVMESNPAYFKTPNYFGPDRRRRSLDMVLVERRKTAHSHREVFGAGENPQVGCFNLPNTLASVMKGVPRMNIDNHQRIAAHDLLSQVSEDYADWVSADIGLLRQAFRTANENPKFRRRNLVTMHAIVKRLEREAGHMDYPLIAGLANTLINALKTDERFWNEAAEIYDAAIKGLETVVRAHIRGNGGALGGALAESLAYMDSKLLRLTPGPVNARRHGVTLQAN